MQYSLTGRRVSTGGTMVAVVNADDKADAERWFRDLMRNIGPRDWTVTSITLIAPVRYRAS